jgi:hypothetical protein
MASRLFVVDELNKQRDEKMWVRELKENFDFRYQILAAMWRLFRFRQRYPDWQDGPRFTASSSSIVSDDACSWHTGLLLLFCSLFAFRLVGHQRGVPEAEKQPGVAIAIYSRWSSGVAIFLAARQILLVAGWVEWGSCRLMTLLLFLGSSELAVGHWETIRSRQRRQGREKHRCSQNQNAESADSPCSF